MKIAEYKELTNCMTDLKTLIILDKRAEIDLKENTHRIGQEAILTIIREFIRLKNDYEKEKEKNKKYIDLHYVPYEQYTSKLNEINKKWQDKIKAKIEEIKKECKYCKFTNEFCQELLQNNNCTQGYTLIILKSLSEKEE